MTFTETIGGQRRDKPPDFILVREIVEIHLSSCCVDGQANLTHVAHRPFFGLLPPFFRGMI